MNRCIVSNDTSPQRTMSRPVRRYRHMSYQNVSRISTVNLGVQPELPQLVDFDKEQFSTSEDHRWYTVKLFCKCQHCYSISHVVSRGQLSIHVLDFSEFKQLLSVDGLFGRHFSHWCKQADAILHSSAQLLGFPADSGTYIQAHIRSSASWSYAPGFCMQIPWVDIQSEFPQTHSLCASMPDLGSEHTLFPKAQQNQASSTKMYCSYFRNIFSLNRLYRVGFYFFCLVSPTVVFACKIIQFPRIITRHLQVIYFYYSLH